MNSLRIKRKKRFILLSWLSRQHIKVTRELGMNPIGFLMMSRMAEPEELAEQTKLTESYGEELSRRAIAGAIYASRAGAASGNRNRRSLIDSRIGICDCL